MAVAVWQNVLDVSEKPKPLLIAALICERLLRETDNVISAVRIVDTFTLPEDLPQDVVPGVNCWALVIFKSGEAIGRYTVTFVMNPPVGPSRQLGEPIPIDLEGGTHGMNLSIQLALEVKHVGIYWIDVLLDGERVTRMPITLRRVGAAQGSQTSLLPPDSTESKG